MPIVRIELWAGRSTEEKAKIIRKLTDATVEVIGCPEGAVQVLIYEVPRSDWGIGGTNCEALPSSAPSRESSPPGEIT